MRKLLFVTALLLPMQANAENRIADSCDRFVESGLRNVNTSFNFDNFSSATRSYFAYEYDEMRQKISNNSTEFGATFPIYEALVNAEGKNANSRQSFQSMREYYRSYASSDIRRQDIDYIFSVTIDSNSVEAWTKCIQAASTVSNASSSPLTARVKGEESEIFQITFNYLPRQETDPVQYTVNNITISDGARVFGEEVIAKNATLKRYSGYTQSFVRTDPTKEITVTVDLAGAASTEVKVKASKAGLQFPLGTIVSSVLPWSQFTAANNEGALYQPAKSKWAPADGRSIAGSNLATAGGGANTPDLRGVFLRGLNRFSDDEQAAVAPNRADPEIRAMGSLQLSVVGQHIHTVQYTVPRNNASKGGGANHEVADSSTTLTATTNACTDCGPETRPTNVAVYYFVRINN